MAKKRILLVNPPFYRLLGSHYNGMSLGLGYIAAFLNQEGHDAWVYNADFLYSEDYKKLYECFKDFEDYNSYFSNSSHPIWLEIVESILHFNPDFVGFSCYTANIKTIQIISESLKKLRPEIRIMVGGPHISVDSSAKDLFPHVDHVLAGEGEFQVLDLIEGRNPRESRISKIHLDDLPFPERVKLWGRNGPLSPKERVNADVSYVITSRGCPYRCTFCASPNIWGRTNTNFRSANNVMKELRHLKEHHWTSEHVDFGMLSSNTSPKQEQLEASIKIKDNTIVYFVDDIFTLNRIRTKELLRNMIDEKLEMPWKCESRADRIDPELAQLMAESGCQRVKIGFESGSDRILKQIKKDETKEEMLRGVRYLKEAKIPITAYFMAGFPGETDDDLRETIDFARSIEADYYSLSIVAPYAGTGIYDDLLVRGGQLLEKEPWEYFYHYSRKLLANNELSEDLIEEFWKLCDPKGYI